MKKFTLRGPWLLALLLLLGWAGRVQAQVTTDPVFFSVDSPVTLTFDATQGTGGLAGYTGDVYIWTGVITNLSANDTNWRYLVGNSFSSPIAAEKMTRVTGQPNKYQITITPRTYYPGLAASGETVRKLAMVFRGANGTPEGKGPGGTDILITVPSAALAVAFTSPTQSGNNPLIVAANSSLSVAATANTASNLTLTLNGTTVGTATNATTVSANVTITQPGVNTLTVTATSGGATATATTTVLVAPTPPTAALPSAAKPDGITYLNNGTSVILSFTAPSKNYVYVVGDFNNWQPTNATLMSKTAATGNATTDAANSRWWVQIDGLAAGTEYAYQFLIDGTQRVADPYCDKILDPNNDQYIPAVTYPSLKAYPTGRTTGIVSVLQPGQTPYAWSAATTNFVRPNRANLVVYELHLRDFIARHDFQTLKDSLHYLRKMGVNAIELMPVSEFEGNDSWGYNPSFYFAVDKYYGTKNAFKDFVDACHARGIAVIMDMVLNHSCGGSPMVQMYFDNSTGKPAANSPWFNVDATHPYNVCYDFNHESPYTRYFSKQVMKYWLTEYKIDGYRFDLSKGFTQRNTPNDVAAWSSYDQSRINIWQDYYNTIVATSSTAYPILEHFADNSEETVLSNIGLMLWGNLNYAFNQATMGYTQGSDFGWGYYGSRGWNQPNLLTYMESHDEERLQFKNATYGNQSGGLYNVRDLATGLKRDEMAAAFHFTQPGPRMIWEFGELGYDYSINACSNGTVSDGCRTSAKPIRWDYLYSSVPAPTPYNTSVAGVIQHPQALTSARRNVYNVYAAMAALKQQPAFSNFTSFTQDLGGSFKQMRLVSSSLSVVTVGNFDVQGSIANVTFPNDGTWYNYLTGAQLTVTGNTALVQLAAGDYAVYTSQRVNLPAGVALSTRASEAAAALKLTLAPNPAAGTTTVSYDLQAAGTATLTVQNLLGQTVRTLAPARQAAGSQSQTLALQGLAPGIYLVQLTTGDLTQTTRLVVQ